MGLFSRAPKKKEDQGQNFTQGYLTGQILVSTPFMTDARFYQSVIYVCGHDENGAMGFIINKPLPSIIFTDLLDQLSIDYPTQDKSIPVFYGGPVEVGRGFVLHSSDYQHESTVQINTDFAITATLEVLREIAYSKGPKYSVLMLGYAGWAQGQLEQELQENQWLVLRGNREFVFDLSVDEMWSSAYDKLGVDPNHMSIDTGHA